MDFETAFSELHQYHGINIYRGGQVGSRRWTKPSMGTEIATVSSVKHRNSHSVATCQTKTVADSSLTPHAGPS